MSQNLDELLREAPTLTFDPVLQDGVDKTAVVESSKESKPQIAEVVLTPEEQKMVDDFAAQIDLKNTQQIMQYGAASQKKIADFSEAAMANVRTKDMGEVGEMLTNVVTELRSIEEEDSKGVFGIFKKNANKLANMKAKYDKAEVNVNRISTALEQHQITLLKDVATLDKMYELNQKKAKLFYDYLDSPKMFKGTVEKGSRSLMNIPFVTGSDELDAKFVKESTAAGFVNLKGHRTVGGMRASIYNAMPIEGVEKLIAFMKEFEANN